MLMLSAMYSTLCNKPPISFAYSSVGWQFGLGLAWLGWPIVLASLRASPWLAGLGGTYFKRVLLVCMVDGAGC